MRKTAKNIAGVLMIAMALGVAGCASTGKKDALADEVAKATEAANRAAASAESARAEASEAKQMAREALDLAREARAQANANNDRPHVQEEHAEVRIVCFPIREGGCGAFGSAG